MGYFAGMVEACFKRDAQGRAIYFPGGIFSKGRIIPDENKVKELKTRINRTYMIMLPAIIALGAIAYSISFPIFLILMGLLTFGFNLYLRSLASGFEISTERFSIVEAYTNQARALGRGWLIALVGMCAVVVVFGLIMAILEPAMLFWTGVSNVVLFGALAALFLFQLRSLGRNGA